MKDSYTTGQVARICMVSIGTIVKEFDLGRLKGFRISGGYRRIPKKALEDFMRENDIPVNGSVFELQDYQI